MVFLWCSKNNSIIDNFLSPNFNPDLIPCIDLIIQIEKESEGLGGCVSLYKAEKPARV
jgi:hypothetical protein